MFCLGHEKPERKSRISVKKRNAIRPVSLFFTNTETVIEKKIAASRKGIINLNSVPISPICGRLKNLGINHTMYAVIGM